jgi:hypothetical protein
MFKIKIELATMKKTITELKNHNIELMDSLENGQENFKDESNQTNVLCPYPGCNGKDSNDLSANSHFRYLIAKETSALSFDLG